MTTQPRNSSNSVTELDSRQLEKFCELINDEAGLVLDKTKYRRRLKRKIRERMKELEVQDAEEYFEKVCFSHESNRELRTLINASVVNETLFYRNQRQMKTLEQEIFPRLMASRSSADRPIRVLSAGCSNGAEPYSIVMAYLEAVRRSDSFDMGEPPDLEVLGVDISTEALEKARQGKYSPRTVENAPDRIVSRYFEQQVENYRVNSEVRDHVSLRYLNLIDSDLPSEQDLILHRNVLIYFESSVRRKVVQRLHRSLVQQGLLVLGHSEDFSPYRQYFESSPWRGQQIYVRSNGSHTGTSLWERPVTSLQAEENASEETVFSVRLRNNRRKNPPRLVLEGSLGKDASRSKFRNRVEEALGTGPTELEIDFSSLDEVSRVHLRELSRLLRRDGDEPPNLNVVTSRSLVENWARRQFEEVHFETPDGSSRETSGTRTTASDRSDRSSEEESSRIDQVLEEASEAESDFDIDVKRTSNRYEIQLRGELDTDENPNVGRLLREEMTNCVDLLEEGTERALAVTFEAVDYVDRNVVNLIKRFRTMTRDKDFNFMVLAPDSTIRSTLERWDCSVQDPARSGRRG